MSKVKPRVDPEEAKARLSVIAEDLTRALGDPDSGHVYLTLEHAEYILLCLQSFLGGQELTLDAAFKVKRPRGAPKSTRPTDQTFQKAKLAMLRTDKSWKNIADELGIDPRSVQRTAERHKKAVLKEMAKELNERIDAKKLLR